MTRLDSRHILILGLAALAASPAAHADSSRARVRVALTAKETGDRLEEKARLSFISKPQPDENLPTIVVDPKRRFQEIVGFGGAVTDAAAETLVKLPPRKQNEVMRAYFDARDGIGYTLARTHINSCDFSSTSYSVLPVEGDRDLKHFTIAKDLEERIPMLQWARRLSPQLKVFASPWSPPAWMKDNDHMLKGGKLEPQWLDTWARCYVRFIEEYGKNGVPIWGLTVQNEPMAVQTWESCIYTAEEERDFVKHHLGPALHEAGLEDVKVMIWDHNRGLLYQRAMVTLEDPEAAKYVWGTAFHWYVGDHFENVRLVHDAFPSKKLLFSEGCHGPFRWEQIGEWSTGEMYGRSIIHDINGWSAGWTDWNILLDETGGPNHVKNFCFAPIIADTRDGSLHYMSSYYYIGHFSKFVRPGARRIACSSTSDDLIATAFVNPDGGKVAVVMNGGDEAKEYQIWTDRHVAKSSLPAHSIVTLRW